MSRTPTDSRERLLQAGRAILAEQGFSGLSLRAVAAKAKLNVGLVSYHFGGKKAFVRELAQGIYEGFFKDFSLEVEGRQDPVKALRAGLLRLATFVRDHRVLARSIVRDLMLGNPEAKAFVTANLPRHGKVLKALIQRCTDEGHFERQPPFMAMTLTMGTLGAPTLMADGLAAMAPQLPFGITKSLVDQNLLSDAALQRRVDLILKALKK